MDDAIRDTYAQLAAGQGEPPEALRRPLLYACFEEGAHDDPERRLGALRVAAHLEPRDRMRVVDPLIRDNDPRVRRYAFNAAVAAQAEGIEALRTAVGGTDLELAVEALGLLVTQLDRPSSLHARQWVHHADPRIRAGAAMLLGNVSGPAMAVHLGRLAQSDPVPGVRAIAAEAVARCTGQAPKVEPRPFWEEGPADLTVAAAPPAAAPVEDAPPVPPVPPAAPPPPAAPTRPASAGASRAASLPTLYPEDPPPRAARLSPVHDEVRDTPADWRSPIPLPGAMPTEAHAVLKLFGRVGEADRVHVLTAWLNLDDPARRAAISGWTPAADPFVGRGLALMVKATGEKTHASLLRNMLQVADPGVRAGAAEAVGATGTLSMIPQLEPLLVDRDPDVRVAAVGALGALLVRLERFGMLRDRLAPFKQDPVPAVKAAVEAALAGIPR